MPKEIRILGVGCAKCEALYDNVIQALDELGIEAEVVHIKDMIKIASHGVMTTPGLWVDGKLISQGRIFSVEELKELFKKL
ncbi:MAG: thioredoxin family protein [Thermodesulfobacteriaceae bacterium]|nr:thioredoxin family protein [Thermodesulfobacteriaceae bacterium]MCX8042376.1 thioredoxin family protein [Thermodesulfobacteriaceae bacterium]MDW8136199.1 thioredoxin family protein [Thermodesulfobacterium sp.]